LEKNFMLDVLGVHSNVSGDASMTGGHAWISLHYTNGRSTTVGLWATSDLFEARRFIRDPIGITGSTAEKGEVEWGLEVKKHYLAKASRYYKLYPNQIHQLVKVIGAYTGWRFTHNCASWATDVVRKLVGEELDSAELLGVINTPRALGSAILKLEARIPTSREMPRELRVFAQSNIRLSPALG
jgi:hypothetical protein